MSDASIRIRLTEDRIPDQWTISVRKLGLVWWPVATRSGIDRAVRYADELRERHAKKVWSRT
jgi:hypothetical protein